MARPTLNLNIVLENVHCYDEGDGWGNAEPYLWPVFFKIDGDSFAVETGSGLIGFPTIESRNGHHENLGDHDVDAGDNVPVPEALGTWKTTLKPIPINDPTIRSLLGEDDLSGFAGVAVVLMEQDGWPDDLADLGYNAFVNAVELAVAKVAAGFQHATHAPTKEEIAAAIKTVKDTAATMVHDAIKGSMSGWQLLWYGTFGNNDDTIGSEVWTVTHDDFEAQAVIDFSRRWSGDESGDGDWEISGSFTGVAPCPADALSSLLGEDQARPSGKGSTGAQSASMRVLDAMYGFREKDYRSLPGLEGWWHALKGAMPEFIRVAVRDAEVRDAAARIFLAVPTVSAAPDEPMSDEHLRDLEAVLQGISKASPSLHRAFAHRALAIMPELRGRSWNSAVRRVAGTRPRGRKR